MSTAGEPPRSLLEWTDHGNGFWTAVGPTDTHWEVRDFGSAAPDRFGITVEHWDHPDWWATTLDAAKDLAAEIDARPPIPKSEWVPDRTVVVPEAGDEYGAYQTSAVPPEGTCTCGSDRPPEAVKPRRESPAWWDDPSAFWRCPHCGTHRGDVRG